MAIAVKAMIVNDGKLLILKRADDDKYKPGIWEIPGGKLDIGENILDGLIREIKEETGLNIEIGRRISIRHFKRDRKLEIEMHIFLCNAIDKNDVKLSDEHSDFMWTSIEKSKEKLTSFFHPEVDLLLDLENEKWP